MGERITFRERGRKHFSNTNAAGYPAQWSRVKFVNGWLTGGVDPGDGSVECGDGTPRPMLATLKQINEIWYRVKDAWFIQGSVFTLTGDPEAEPAIGYMLDYPASHSANRSYAVDAANYTYRGYTTAVEGGGFSGPGAIPLRNDPFLDAEYDRGDTEMWRDIGDKERGIWINGEYFVGDLPYWNEKDILLYENAFSWHQDASTEFLDANFFSLTYFDYDGFTDVENKIATGTASVVFSGEIAVVKVDPADDIFAPTNLFYIGVKFIIQATDATVGGLVTASTDIADIAGTPVNPCNYVMRLADDIDLTCPIYVELWPVGTGFAFVGGEDFIHEAQEWFPYKTKADLPAWDYTTGLPLNGGPGA